MPLPVIAATFRVAFLWEYITQRAVNVAHFTALAGGDADDLFAALNANVTSTMWGATSTTAEITSVEILPLDGTTPTSVHNPTGGEWNGGSSTSGVPAVAAILSMKTAHRGPSGRGRLFLPFVGEGAMNNGILETAYRNDIQAGWDAFVPAMVADDFQLVVASYTDAIARIVTNWEARDAVGTQRRRQDRLQ